MSAWVERYIRAWNTNDPDEVAGLFTDDAVYLTGPLDIPWNGKDRIVEGWLEAKDEPGTTSFTYEVIAVDGELGVVQGRARYLEPPAEYGNLCLIRLAPDGRCSQFTEYWMKAPA